MQIMDLWSLSDLSTPWSIHVAATLKVANHIAAGATEIQQLADACGADTDALHRMMRHLVSKGVFQQTSPGSFALNDVAKPLLEEGIRLGLNLDSIGGRMAHAWASLLPAIRTGKPAYSQVFGRAFWDDLEAHPDIAEDFDKLMGAVGHGTPDPDILPNADEWQSIRTVMDVGGGTGALLAEILRAHPEVTGTLLDLPSTVARSETVFREAGVADRVKAVAQSFFEPLPAGHDLYVMKSVLNDWPDPEAGAILKRCADAARPNGRVVTYANAGPGQQADPELLMLVLVGGRARSVDDLNQLASAAGLAFTGSKRQSSGRLVVEYRPVQ